MRISGSAFTLVWYQESDIGSSPSCLVCLMPEADFYVLVLQQYIFFSLFRTHIIPYNYMKYNIIFYLLF